MMIKISATQCDAWLKYCNDIIDENQLKQTLLKTGNPSIKMELGTMFHSLIENQDADVPMIFNAEQINHARTLFQGGMHEAKTRKRHQSKHGEIAITGVADYLVGRRVMEAKTTWGAFSIDKYLDSIQWQMYCWLFEADEIEYVVFEFPAPSTKWKTISDIDSELQYKSFHSFTLRASQMDEQHIKTTIDELHRFIIVSGIEDSMQLTEDISIFELF
jgi:hypothetical protein